MTRCEGREGRRDAREERGNELEAPDVQHIGLKELVPREEVARDPSADPIVGSQGLCKAKEDAS